MSATELGHDARGATTSSLLGHDAPVALFTVDASWRIVAANPAACRLTGTDEQVLLGRSFATVLTIAGQVLHQSTIAPHLLAHGQIAEVAIDVRRADGQTIPALLAGRTRDEQTRWAVLALTPVGDRRDHERELRAAREQADAAHRRTQHLLAITRSLAEAHNLAEVEQAVREHLRTLGARLAGFWVRDRRTGELCDLDGTRMPTETSEPVDHRVLGRPGAAMGYLAIAPLSVDADHLPLAVVRDHPALTALHPQQDEELLEALVTATQQAVARLSLLDQLRRQASTDELTGLANRRSFDRTLQSLLAERARNPAPLTLFYLDLDGFKGVNDRHGHAAGDRLLRTVADDLRHVVRGYDLLARLGGDEFAVIVRELPSRVEVEGLANRIVEALLPDVGQLGVSASIGAVHCAAHVAASDPDLLLQAADGAMYVAKRDLDRAVVIHELGVDPSADAELDAALDAEFDVGTDRGFDGAMGAS